MIWIKSELAYVRGGLSFFFVSLGGSVLRCPILSLFGHATRLHSFWLGLKGNRLDRDE